MLLLPLSLTLSTAICPTNESAFDVLESRGASMAFLAALEDSGMRAEVEAMGPVTLLAPTDEAFAAIPSEIIARLFQPGSRGELRRILGMHVVAAPLPAMAFVGQSVPNLAGEAIEGSFQEGRVTLSGAPMVENDIQASGSIVHMLDRVILPPATPTTPAMRISAMALRAAAPLGPEGQAAVYDVALASIVQLEPGMAAGVADARAAADRASAMRALLGSLQGVAGSVPQGEEDGAKREGDMNPAETSDNDSDSTRLISFDGSDSEPSWFTLNDDVMGGISQSRFERSEEGFAVFSGALSLENNGGFATIRSSQDDYDLTGAKGFRFRVRGDGREYGFNALAGDERGRVGSWRKRFDAPAGQWTTIDIPIEELVLNIRGRSYPEVGPPDREGIRSFSFIIADKDETPFRLEIDWIAAYR